jgi:hypothetical protein
VEEPSTASEADIQAPWMPALILADVHFPHVEWRGARNVRPEDSQYFHI